MLLKFALRNLKKRPLLNLIKIIGLTMGLCGVLFITLFLKSELSFDTSHSKANRIYRLTNTSLDAFEGAQFARIQNSKNIPELATEIPEIESLVRLMPLRDKLLLKEEQHYSISQAFAVDTSFLTIFDVALEDGNKHTALEEPGSAILSKSLAKKIFGNENPIGKLISLPPGHYNSIETDFTIKGVMQDFPHESHLHPELLVMPGEDTITGWAYVYVLLKEHTHIDGLAHKISNKLNDVFGVDAASSTFEAHLTNLKDIHLHSNLLREIEPNGSLSNSYILSIAGLILLFISLSNFTSLNLGMAVYLKKFLALNQILGSSKKIMLRYFLLESTIVVVISLILVVLASVKLNRIIADNYQIDLVAGNGIFAFGVLLVFGILGVMAGIQPVVTNSLKKVSLDRHLKGVGTAKTHKVLLVSQFALAMVLLIGVLVISKQTNFAFNNAMGAAKNNVLCIPFVHAKVQEDFNLFKTTLAKHSAIGAISAMMSPPGGETNDMFPFTMQDKPNTDNNNIGIFSCDYAFTDVFELPFLSGKKFNTNRVDEDGNGEYIINATALHYLGYQDANAVVGKKFALVSPVPNVVLPKGKIVGVVKDFHLSGLQTKVAPLALFKRSSSWLENIVISYQPERKDEAVATIKKTWETLFPKYPLSYYPVNTLYKNVYKTERLQKNLILIFALIALFVSTMGVLGLSLLLSQRRFKEIGVRKVNGATISEIIVMLTADFLKWVLLAFFIAIPIAYYGAYKWLQTFAYKIDITLWMFLLAGGITIVVTMLTVSWHSYKAAKQNPVVSLRRE